MLKPFLAATSLALLLCSCASTSSSYEDDERWLEPSPTLRRQIEDQIERLPWTHGVERVEQIQWFAGVGEPAFPYLLDLCADPRCDVAAAAVAALGATGDSRLVEPLRSVQWTESDDKPLRYERARAFLRLGDWSQIQVLVDGLEEESSWARGWCLAALKESTRLDFGFDPTGSAEERATSVERWRDWVSKRLREGLVAEGTR